MNITLFKTPRFLVLYLLRRPYRRSANHAIRTTVLPGDVQLGPSSMIYEFRPPASIRGNMVSYYANAYNMVEANQPPQDLFISSM